MHTMPSSLIVRIVWLFASAVSTASTEYGLTGFPAKSYDPICATACLRSFSTLTLNCSSEGETVGMVTFQTSTECYAINTPYLTSVAWCAHVKCAEVQPSASLTEYWWYMQITGQKSAGVAAAPAKWTYAEALAQVKSVPIVQLDAGDTSLNDTSLASPSVYEAQYNVLYSTQREGTVENGFGIAMLVTGFGLSITISWLGYFPFISRMFRRLRPYLVWPSTVERYHVQSLPYLLGKAPLAGHALSIVLMVALNIVFTSVDYESRQPNAWNPTKRLEITSYVLARTGNFAYILMPLVFLFAGRNNILLWVTNWSHSTFLVLHRWVARIFTVQVLLHSIISLVKYLETGMYDMEKSKPYWIWGIVATLCVVVLCFGSGLYFRNFFYQGFLVVHIILSVVLVVGCWYHAYDLYGLLGRYVYWVYATAAVWAFDRVGRVLRLCSTGPRRARITELGGENGYVRIGVPGIRWSNKPGMHAYLYFPVITPLKPWENHPFSVMSTIMLRASLHRGKVEEAVDPEDFHNSSDTNDELEKSIAVTNSVNMAHAMHPSTGLTFFVRKGVGSTKHLQAHDNLLALVAGPYPNNSSSQVLHCDCLLLIGGGIGITALIPFLARHWNIKLCWSVQESGRCLDDELGGALTHVHDRQIRVGRRLDIGAVLVEETKQGWQKLGIVILGPPQLCDDARAIVVAIAKQYVTTEFVLEVEAYSW